MQNVSKRVLVAEDNPGLAHVLQYNLEQNGFDVSVAHDGTEALELAQREQYDIVVTDHEMPQMTGVELCTELRKLPNYQTTPVVMVTARALEIDTTSMAQRLGVSAIMPKPYSPDELMSTVAKLLAGEAIESP